MRKKLTFESTTPLVVYIVFLLLPPLFGQSGVAEGESPRNGASQSSQLTKGKGSMSQIIPLTEEKIPTEGYIFKHSSQCPISAAAAEVVRAHRWDLPVYWINVIEQRPISNWIEETLGVRHESPQLITIRDGKATKTLTHRAIQEANL